MPQHAMFKNPSPGYESFVERYCLRRRKNGDISGKQELLKKAQNAWSNEYKDGKKKTEKFLKLRDDAKPFVTYLFYVKYCFTNNATYPHQN